MGLSCAAVPRSCDKVVAADRTEIIGSAADIAAAGTGMSGRMAFMRMLRGFLITSRRSRRLPLLLGSVHILKSAMPNAFITFFMVGSAALWANDNIVVVEKLCFADRAAQSRITIVYL